MEKNGRENRYGKQGLIKAAAGLAAFAAVAAAGVPAFASEKESIEEISLYIESEISEGETDSMDSVSIEIDTDGCYLDESNTKITNEPDDGWDDDDKPKLKIVVKAEDGYAFKSGLGKDDIYVDDSSIDVTGVNRTSSKVTISVTLPEVSETSTRDDDFSLDIDEDSLAWDESGSGLAYWDGNDYAKYYEVRLYKSGSAVGSEAKKTEDNQYSFASQITSAGNYTFKVRAVWSSSEKGSWEESETFQFTSDQVAAFQNGNSNGSSTASSEGTWVTDSVGTWWCRTNRTWPSNDWQYIDGVWYWFNAGGYRVENQWVLVNGNYYYLGAEGKMAVSTRTPDGYLVDANGAWDGGAAWK